MGGLLFGTSRLPLIEFNKYRANIESIMKFYEIEYKIPLYYKDKKDFGDLDVLIKDTVPTETLMRIFARCECNNNGESVISFNYKDFQIDFIKIKPEDFNIAYHYYSYNDLGNLIGQLAKYNHLKFGFDGLTYNHYIKGQKLGNILISKNIDKILSFLDLSPAKFHQGFDTLKEVFDYIVKSKYFNPYVSDLEPYGYSDAGVALYRINKMNRERNTKRKTYQEWLEYVKPLKTGEDNYKFREDGNLQEIYDRVDKFFPEAHFKEKLDAIQKDRVSIKDKFNGNVIKKLCPELKKEDFQFFIDSFRTARQPFSEYIINSSQDTINKDILNFFDTFKKKYGE